MTTPSVNPSPAEARSHSSPTAAALFLVAASVLWGTTGLAASFVDERVSPIAIGAATMGVGGLLLFATSARSSVGVMRSRDARPWLIAAVVGIAVYPIAFYWAMDEAGVAIGNVVALGSGPVFAAVLETVVDRSRLGRRWLISTGMAVAGIVILSTSRDEGRDEAGNIPLGVILGLIAGAAYALYTFSTARIIANGSPGRAVMGASFGLGAVVLAPVVVLFSTHLTGRGETIAIIAYLAIGPMFVAYVLFGRALTSLRSTTVTTITLLEPVIATMLAVAVIGERLQWWGWVGLFLILIGVSVLVSARRSRNVLPPA